MVRLFGTVNWTAVLLTLVICCTLLEISKRMRGVARIWLEGLKVQRDITYVAHGYTPKGERRQ